MSQRRQRPYRRLDRAERAAIERGLDKNRPARAMARDLGRSQSSVADEVRRNRTVTRGPGKGSRVESVPEGACARLRGWPHVCNGCNRRRYHCSMPFRCEYSAARAQLLADGELSAARRGVDRTEEEFESIAAKIRADLARGLSPAQIADARSSEFRAAPSTIYRWIERGYAGMSNMDLRRKVGYRPRRRAFQRMFGLVLTDNGAEFSDWESLERSCLPGKGARCRVYYCDVRQSQQKGGCERNHVELRKLLPKRRGISFDDLEAADMAAVMSQLNSEPRPSMAFMPPLRALLAAYGDDGAALTAALGVEEVPYGELLLGVEAVNRARLERGADPLI